MNDNAQITPLEVNAVFPKAITIQLLTLTFQLTETIQIPGPHILGKSAKISQDIQLKILRHLGQLPRTGRIKNNLKRRHDN